MHNGRNTDLDEFNLNDYECHIYLRKDLAASIPTATLASLQRAFAPDPVEIIKTQSGGMLIGLRNVDDGVALNHLLRTLSFWNTLDMVFERH